MSSICQNIKTEYDSLKTLKEAFSLVWATAKESGDFSSVRQLKKDLEHAQDVLEEKLWEPWATPLIPNEMIIESHKEGIHFVDPSDIELYFEPEQLSDGTIKGAELLKRLADKQGLSASILDFLRAHSELIPENWKKDESGKTRYIYFTDTIYRESDRLYVRCLNWDGSKWSWSCDCLDNDWRSWNPSAILVS